MCSQAPAGGEARGAREGKCAYRWADRGGGGDGGQKAKTGARRREGLGAEIAEIPFLLPFDNWAGAGRYAARVRDGRCRRDSDGDNTDWVGRLGLAG